MADKTNDTAIATEPGLQNKIISAFTGAVLTSLLMTPFDLVKTRQQSQTLVRKETLLPAIHGWKAATWVPRNARNRVEMTFYSCLCEPNAKNAQRSVNFRTSASLCLCADVPIQSTAGNTNSGSGNVITTWRQLYREMIALPQAAQAHIWQQMEKAGYVVGPKIERMVPEYQIKGTVSGMRHIAKTEGIRTLWRGLSPTLVASGPSTVIYFVGYDYLRQWLGHQMKQNPSAALYEKYASLLAGCIARTAAATVISPLELVRTRMQSSATHDLKTVMQGISADISRGGLGTLWRGLVPTLWRDVPFSAIYWFGYERWRENVYEPMFTDMLTGSKGEASSEDARLLERLAIAFFSGASSGIVAATVTNPFDVAKTRRQIEEHASPKSHVAHHRSFGSMIRHIVAKEGMGGLFAGLSPRLMKIAPSCAIMISSYELGKQVLSSAGDKDASS
ncbi:Carrier protein, mitochondrial [Dipsacomyces acuminosporus]|nr:Carrier protein, mitochondrial [Dipsacomyces acuminosporus]